MLLYTGILSGWFAQNRKEKKYFLLYGGLVLVQAVGGGAVSPETSKYKCIKWC